MHTPNEIRNITRHKKLLKRVTKPQQYAAYKKISERGCSYKTWGAIVSAMSDVIREDLFAGRVVELPYQMGCLAVRKKTRKIVIGKNGKPRLNTPVDWKATVDLWSENEEAHKAKVLVRYDNPELYAIEWTKIGIKHLYKERFYFKVARKLQRGLAKKIKEEGSLDCERLRRKDE